MNIEPIVLDVDIKQKNYIKEPQIRHGDVITLKLQILDDGVPVKLSDVATASLVITRHDKVVIVLAGTIDGNGVLFELGGSEVSIAGRVNAVAQFYDVDGRVSTASFSMVALTDPTGEGFEPSERENTLIELVLGDGVAILADAQTATAASIVAKDALTTDVGVALVTLETDKTAAIDRIDTVKNENKTRFLNAVETVALRDSTYPNPTHGDTVRVTSTATSYRFVTGTGWVITDVYNPTVIDSITTQLADTALDIDRRGTSLEKFGVVGGGIVDDTVALENALNSGLNLVGESGKNYRISRTIVVNKDVHITSSANSPFYIRPDGAFTALAFNGVEKISTSLTSSVVIGESFLNLASVNGVEKGDLVELSSNKLWLYDNRGSLYKGEVNIVEGIEGLKVNVLTPSWDNYVLGEESVTVKVFKPLRVLLDNLQVLYSAPQQCSGISLSNNVDCSITNVKVENAQLTGLVIRRSFNTTVHNFTGVDINDVATGYAIQDSGSVFTNITDSSFRNNRRGVDFSGSIPSRGGTVYKCLVVGGILTNDSGFGTHGTAEHIEFSNNIIIDVNVGFTLRGGGITVKDNTLIGNIAYGVTASDGTDFEITGNTYTPNHTNKAVSTSSGSSYRHMETFFQLTSNALNGSFTLKNNKAVLRNYFVHVSNTAARLDNLVCENNSIKFSALTAGTQVNVFFSSVPFLIANSSTVGNQVSVEKGTYNQYRSDISLDVNSCSFDDYDVKDSAFIEGWSGGGTFANVGVWLKLSKNKKIVSVNGHITFDILTAPTAVRTKPLPSKLWDTNASAVYFGESFRQGLLTFFDFKHSQSSLYLSYNTSKHDIPFPVGTGYKIPISLRYMSA